METTLFKEACLTNLTLSCDANGMRAEITISDCSSRPTVQELLTLLRNQHVVFGIDQSLLKMIAKGVCAGGVQTVAIGKPARPGTPGRLEWCIDLSRTGKPRELADGRVNLRDLQTHCNVTRQQQLVRVFPPVSGEDGMTVFGTPVSPTPLEPLNFTLGKGTCRDENEPELIRAAIEGAVVFDGGTLQVVNRRVITGDVDYSTGNISFTGDMKIAGTVRAGFSVSVTGDLFIGGNVEDATVLSGGSVTVQGGASGSGNGTVKAADTITVHHVSQFLLHAEKAVQVEEDALHCTIHSDGPVRARSIVGGTVTAQEVFAEVIGSVAEIRTVIDIAGRARLSRERYDLLKRYGVVAAAKAQEFEKLYLLVRDGMDEDGYLKGFEEQILASMKDNTLESIRTCRTIQERIEKIDRMEETQGESLIVSGVVHPNTLLKVGLEERLVREMERNVRLTSGRGVHEK